MAEPTLDLINLLCDVDSFLYLSLSVVLRSLKLPSFSYFKALRSDPKQVILHLLYLIIRQCDDDSTRCLTQTGELLSERRP